MRHLISWTDRNPRGARPGQSTSDRGPLRRLLDHSPTYDQVTLLTSAAAAALTEELASEIRRSGPDVDVRVVDLPDPSDHAAIFAALTPIVAGLRRDQPVDVVLSAGTPQAQTLWVILVKSGLLNARMLQVIPPMFVPVPHPEPVREVRLDIEGFPEITALRAEVGEWRAKNALLLGGLVGDSPPMRALARRVARLAPTDVPVLVEGETGVGKERVARALHDGSRRSGGPFVAESCGSFTDGLLASELFGHEQGAFTGAHQRRRGLFEMADGGTLFLDEVGEMPPRVQVMLLRVLQEGRFRRVGGEAPVVVDVRVVAATHRSLPEQVAAGTFREDLFYRLKGASVRVPPLRERGDDLPALVAHFLRERGRADLTLSRSAWAALRAHRWPGNVRELRSEVVRWTIFCDRTVEREDLSEELTQPEVPSTPIDGAVVPLRQRVQAVERQAIEHALAALGGNLSQAARALGIDRNTLKRKRRQLA
jgi:DNA-binding NtrC family response regulator